jgi:hypothetical protein
MFTGGNASGYLNIYFAFGIPTLLKTSEQKAVKVLGLNAKRELNFFCTTNEAGTMIFPKGRDTMVGTDYFINAITKKEPPIIRGYRNLI